MEEVFSSFFQQRKRTIKDLEKMRNDPKTLQPMELMKTIHPPPKLVPTVINEQYIEYAAIHYFDAYEFQGKYYVPNEQIERFREYLIDIRKNELEKYYEDLNQERDEIEFKLSHPSTLYILPRPSKRPSELYSN